MSFFKKHSSKATTESNNITSSATATHQEDAPHQESGAQQTAGQQDTSTEGDHEPAVTNESDGEATACLKTKLHLKAYPMVQETSDYLKTFPITQSIKDTTHPVLDPALKYSQSQYILKPILEGVDDLGDSTLNGLDWLIPCAKTMTIEDAAKVIKAPFVKTDESLRQLAVASGDVWENSIVTPSRKALRETRSYYNKNIYDTKGKPLLRSSLDPVFRPVNSKFEEFAETHLPKGNAVPNDYSSEIERNFHLSIELINRSVPVVGEGIYSTAMAPCQYSNHVFEVFQENLGKQTGNAFNSSIVATYNTSKELTDEALNSTVEAWNKLFKTDENKTTATNEAGQATVEEQHPSTVVPATAGTGTAVLAGTPTA